MVQANREMIVRGIMQFINGVTVVVVIINKKFCCIDYKLLCMSHDLATHILQVQFCVQLQLAVACSNRNILLQFIFIVSHMAYLILMK